MPRTVFCVKKKELPGLGESPVVDLPQFPT
jgi:hypothetical protein